MNRFFVVWMLLPVFALADVVVPADKVEESVNIRLEADTTSDVVGKLYKGDSLPLVQSTEGWHEVEIEGGATAYISADWVRVEPDPIEVAEEAEEVAEALVEDSVAELTQEPVAHLPEEQVEAAVEEVAAATEVEEVAEVSDPEPEVRPAPDPQPEPVPEPAPELQPVPEPVPVVQDVSKVGRDYVAKGGKSGELGNSQIFDNGNQVGIGTLEPQQRLEVNGSVQIHDQNSNVAGLMITQAAGDTGYIMHNRASTLTIGAGSIDRITIDRDGNVGFAVSRPEHPLEMASGAHVTAGGVWTNRSSRDSKEQIAEFPVDDALAAIMRLEPVSFRYTAEQGEDYVGFIAEDVPAILTSSDGKSLNAMDIVAALTRVVQEQQRRIEALEAKLEER